MTHEEFILRYYRELPNHKLYRQAYEAAESQYFAIFGHNKYSTYAVFRATLSRYQAVKLFRD